MHVPGGRATVKTMPLRYISSIDFLLGEHFGITDFASGTLVPFSMCSIAGSRPCKKDTDSEGQVISFSIRFRPGGLFGLLGISADLFPDQSIDGEQLHAVIFREMAERLTACSGIDECMAVVEPCLLHLGRTAAINTYPAHVITEIAI